MITFLRLKPSKFGGAETYLLRLTDELKKAGIKHKIKYTTAPRFLSSWMKALWYNFEVCISKKESFYFSLERVTCPDIYRAGDGVHKVFMEVEQKSKLNPLHFVYLYIEKKLFNNAKKIIANSYMIKKQIIDTYNIEESKIVVIYNGMKLQKMNLDLSLKKLQHEFSIDKQQDKIFIYVGSGFQRKGVEEFLTILSKLKKQNFKAFVIGKEKRMDYYKKLAKQFNIDSKVIFTGARDDVSDFYAIGDIFLFPTRYEPFSNVVLEAMNYENVVITTRQNGASEILNAEYVMNRPDDYSIVEKIDLLLSNENKLKELKEENLKIVQNFSIEKNMKETLKVIDEVTH